MATTDDDSELECRVCRGGPDLPSRPLFSPCLCSGSIGLVHQDCLEAWLKHSHKESCELCKQKYTFDPEYKNDVPGILPMALRLLYSVSKFLLNTTRVVLAIFIWLLCAPSCTNLIYKMWFRNNAFSKTFKDFDYSRFPTISTMAAIFRDSTSGLVLMGVIVISFIVLISFADFLRLDPLEERAAVPGAGAGPVMPVQPAAAAAVRQQQAQHIPRVAHRRADINIAEIGADTGRQQNLDGPSLHDSEKQQNYCRRRLNTEAAKNRGDGENNHMGDVGKKRSASYSNYPSAKSFAAFEALSEDVEVQSGSKMEINGYLLDDTDGKVSLPKSASSDEFLKAAVPIFGSAGHYSVVENEFKAAEEDQDDNFGKGIKAENDFWTSRERKSMEKFLRERKSFSKIDFKEPSIAESPTTPKDLKSTSRHLGTSPHNAIQHTSYLHDPERNSSLDMSDADKVQKRTDVWNFSGTTVLPGGNPACETAHDIYFCNHKNLNSAYQDEDVDENVTNLKSSGNDVDTFVGSTLELNTNNFSVENPDALRDIWSVPASPLEFKFGFDSLSVSPESAPATPSSVWLESGETERGELEVGGEEGEGEKENSVGTVSVEEEDSTQQPTEIENYAESENEAETEEQERAEAETVEEVVEDEIEEEGDVEEELLDAELGEDEFRADPFDDNDIIDAFNGRGADLEIHIALDEVLGIRPDAPWQVMPTSFVWLMLINAIYLALFFALPATIGSKILNVLGASLSPGVTGSNTEATPFATLLSVETTTEYEQFNSAILKSIFWAADYGSVIFQAILPMNGMRRVGNLISSVIEKSSASGGSLEVIDVCQLCVGYFSIFGTIYWLFQLCQLLEKVAAYSRSVGAVIGPIKSLARVAKVFVLLYLRIFILPMCLGACVLSSTNVLLKLPHDVWVTFIATNIVGSIALTWVLGITYMLIVTLSVLQLREVLHPQVLAKSIRPQEAHLDLLSSLLMDSGVNHVRRMCVSMVVYIVLMVLLVVSPIWFARHCAELFNLTHLLTIRTWYISPEIQLPFELAAGHIAFLSALVRWKDVIGRMQHVWLVYACDKLDLTRFLLPQLIKKTTGPQGEVLVGRPIRRPPIGWDARNMRNTTRWAWGPEEPSELEKQLAPRAVPSYWLARTLLLSFLSWILLIFTTIGMTLLPIACGRAFFYCAGIPSAVQHDPVSYIIGALICLTFLALGRSIASFLSDSRKVTGLMKSLLQMDRHSAFLIARMVVASNLTIFFMGLAQRMIFSLMALKHTFPSDTWMYDPVMLFCVWVRGLTTFAFIVGVLVMTNLGDEVQKNLNWLGGGRDNARERQQDRLRRRDIRFRDDVANGGILRRGRNRGRNVRPNVPAANNPPHRANQPAPRQDSALTLYMKVVIMVAQEIMNNAVEGRWDEAQTTRLNWMWSNLVAPMFKEIAYSMAVQNICWPFVERQLMNRILPYLTQQQEFPINDRLEAIVWQILALATALGWLTHIEGFDFESIWDRVMKHVRDDNYLVGRKLQNREAAPAAAVPESDHTQEST